MVAQFVRFSKGQTTRGDSIMKYTVYRSDNDSIDVEMRDQYHSVLISITIKLEQALKLAKAIEDQCKRIKVKA
jgi:hypothetical protein